MDECVLKVLLVESGKKEASIKQQTFSTATGRCEQVCVVFKLRSLLEALQEDSPEGALLSKLLL